MDRITALENSAGFLLQAKEAIETIDQALEVAKGMPEEEQEREALIGGLEDATPIINMYIELGKAWAQLAEAMR